MDDCKPQAAALVIFELCFSGAVIWLCGHPGPRSVLLAALLAVLQLLALGWTFRNIHLRLRAMAGMLSLHEEQERAAAEHSARLLTAQTRLFALQNQINPHFLYNTFDTIRSIALEQNQEDIAQMTKALANLFRYSISRPGEMATLAEEIDNSKSYLLIQQYRFPGKFTVEWQVDETDEAVMNCVLPVLTLQPLFENALHHGIEPMMSSGNITVRIWTTQDRLEILIKDNGVGIDEARLKEVRQKINQDFFHAREPVHTGPAHSQTTKQKGIGIALANVHQRIKSYFGEDYGLEIYSTAGVETTLRISVPKTREHSGGRL